VFLNHHSPAISVMVPALTGADGLAITTPITIAITIDGGAIGTDPHVSLRHRDRTIGSAGSTCEGRKGRQAERCRKQNRVSVHESLQITLPEKRID
jgi:hypothetical protein